MPDLNPLVFYINLTMNDHNCTAKATSRVLIDEIVEKVNRWINRDIFKLTIQECINEQTKEVVCDVLPSQIRSLLKPFGEVIPRTVFGNMFSRSIDNATQSWETLMDLFNNSLERYRMDVDTLSKGNQTVFSRSLKILMHHTDLETLLVCSVSVIRFYC